MNLHIHFNLPGLRHFRKALGETRFLLRISIIVAITTLQQSAEAQRRCLIAEQISNNNVVEGNGAAAPFPGTIVIPVVVHVVYNNQEQNISNEQIRSQIAVLNKDFRKKNDDAAYIPAAFKDIAADAQIEFRLATIDPNGLPTNGITRTKTAINAFSEDNMIKSASSGGADAWNRDEYLNIWVGNLGAGIMGYASLPGSEPSVDGVVIRYSAFGTTNNVIAPFNRGRTTVHEIGHWLGLRHIWGDSDCGDDRIDDTPPQQGPTRGCPSGVVASCSNGATGSMYMNFMDFTNDECTNMFTGGQVEKMRSQFSIGAARYALLSSGKAVGAHDDYASPLQETLVSVYPNPGNNHINVRIADHLLGADLTLYSLRGEQIHRTVARASITRVSLDRFAPGVYFVKVGAEKIVKVIRR
jgi:hypothetical protein